MTSTSERCPICFAAAADAIGGKFYRCRTCGNAFNDGYSPKSYDDDYFLDEYLRQYGKTYVDDFDAIYAASKNRVRNILAFRSSDADKSNLSLLDIGSAAGFFLKCARDLGIADVSGVEISAYAAKYCHDRFSIPVTRASFIDVELTRKYDIITAWYFIEHCRDTAAAIGKIYDALRPGGVFAFSSPSIFGPLYAFNRKEWMVTHPEDHRVDFSPRGVKYFLKQRGFSGIIVRPAGIHPERMVNKSSILYKPFARLYEMFSRMAGFSDTIEVYAVKKK